jgi:hypothetical protein
MRYLTLKLSLDLLLLCLIWTTQVRAVLAGPHFTLTPATDTGTVGSSMKVILGVDSGTEKMIAGDAQMTFDASKLELVSVTKVDNPALSLTYNTGDANINNVAGTVYIGLYPSDSSVYNGSVVSGPLFTLSFRLKATGTATVGFTCVAGAIAKDTNIINATSADVIDCTVNQSGSYTINAATGGSDSPTSTPTPTTSTSTAATATTSQLPKTGNLSATLTLMVVGLVSVVGGVMLKWL